MMVKFAAVSVVLLFLLASCLATAEPTSLTTEAENSWLSKTSMSTSRAYPGVAAVNGKMYIIGGDAGVIVELLPKTDLSYNFVNTNEEYDLTIDNWTVKQSMPTARALFGISTCDDKIYCIGGYSNGVRGVNEAYDPATDSWETLSPLPAQFLNVQANTINGTIYCTGLNSNLIYAYNPKTDSWTQKTPAQHAIISRVSAVFDNKIFFVGELTDSSGHRYGACILTYDPAKDVWTTINEDCPVSGLEACGGATYGVFAPAQIYFFDDKATNICNLTDNTWTVGEAIPSARVCAGIAVINDTFFVVGGRTSQQWGDPRLLHNAMFPSALNEQYVPVGYGNLKPVVSPVSPEEKNTPEYFSTLITSIAVGVVVIVACSFVYHKRKR